MEKFDTHVKDNEVQRNLICSKLVENDTYSISRSFVFEFNDIH